MEPHHRARAVIADDERLMREQLRARLGEVWPSLEIVGEAKNGSEAVELAVRLRPDVVFLDIRMPGMSGVEAARRIADMELEEDEWLPEIVFITAYDQYAVEAFEQGVVDYVLKPAERERLALTVQRVQRRLAARAAPDGQATGANGQTTPPAPAADPTSVETPARAGHPDDIGATLPLPLPVLLQRLAARLEPGRQRAPLKWIQASVGSAIQLIPVEEVLFFISDEKYTRVQTARTEALIRKPIKELVDELDPEIFWRIHRSTLVNVRAIANITRDERGRQIVSVHGHPGKLEVSRSYAGLFKGM